MARPSATALAIGFALFLAGCATELPRQPGDTPEAVRARLLTLIPPRTADAAGWAADIQTAFSLLGIAPTTEALCSAIAVIEQESSFRADPSVPGLGTIAWKEIDSRAARLGIPAFVVRTALRIDSGNGRSYAERIDAARTERELSEIFEDLIGRVPMGKRLFGGWNPVRTGGPMQVSVAFAESHAASRRYPFADARSIRDEVFTRRGGLYFGIAHLLDYPASYDRSLYRFADFNAGRYASRNAAFQNAVAIVTGTPIALDGDVLLEDADLAFPGETEQATRKLGPRLGLTDAQIRRDLSRGNSHDFEQTATWRGVMALADAVPPRSGGAPKPVPRAVLPRIQLQGPKITRTTLTTAWFAERVDGRRQQCLARGEQAGGR